GPSGCGKSTLLGVLLGLVAPDGGSVRVGDVDLGELDIDRWRARLAWVPQHPHLFATSVAENVRLGRADAPADDVAGALAAGGRADGSWSPWPTGRAASGARGGARDRRAAAPVHGASRRRAAGRGHAARRRSGRGGHRVAGHLGLADLACVPAPVRVGPWPR